MALFAVAALAGCSSSSSSEVSLGKMATNCVGGDDETASNVDKSVLEGPEVNEVKVVFVKYPDECCPLCCPRKGDFCMSQVGDQIKST